MSVAPVEARFVRLRILSNHGDRRYVQCADVKVIEAARPGYTRLLARHPELVALASGRLPPVPEGQTTEAAVTATIDAGPLCAPARLPAPPVPAKSESRNVLVLARDGQAAYYTPTGYKPTDVAGRLDYSIYGRIRFVTLAPRSPRPAT